MFTSTRSTEEITSMVQPSAAEATASPDPSWKGFYTAGGISVFLYIILGLILPTILFVDMPEFLSMDGQELLEFIAENRVWFLVLQTLVLAPSILMVVVFASLFAALKHLNKSYAALGSIVAITSQILFVAYYPVLMGLVYMSEQYIVATASRQANLAIAAEALLAQNNAFNPLYEAVFAFSILIISLVMLKGVFHKMIAYLGIASCAAAFIALSLQPFIGINYFWWWLPLMVWFIAVGWKLYRLGSA